MKIHLVVQLKWDQVLLCKTVIIENQCHARSLQEGEDNRTFSSMSKIAKNSPTNNIVDNQKRLVLESKYLSFYRKSAKQRHYLLRKNVKQKPPFTVTTNYS